MLRASSVPTPDKGQGRVFFIFHSLSVNCFSFDSLSSATTYFNLNQRNEMRVNRTCVSGIYHLSDVSFFFFFFFSLSLQLLSTTWLRT